MSITVNTGRTSGPERSVAAELVKPLTGVIAVRKSPEGRRDIFATCVVVVVLLAAMEITSRFVPDYIMPSPVTVWKAARELFFSDPYHVAVTLVRLAISVMIAMITGVLIGLAMGMFPSVRPYLKAIVVIDTGIPALSWMLIAVFWFRIRSPGYSSFCSSSCCRSTLSMSTKAYGRCRRSSST